MSNPEEESGPTPDQVLEALAQIAMRMAMQDAVSKKMAQLTTPQGASTAVTHYKVEREVQPDISVPNEAKPSDAAQSVTSWAHDLAQPYEFTRVFPYHPKDGAAATHRALKRVFGTEGQGKVVKSMFGANPPQLITVPTQELVYRTATRGHQKDETFYDSKIWPILDLVKLAGEEGVDVPSPYSESDRNWIVQALTAKWTVVDTVQSTISVPWGQVEIDKFGTLTFGSTADDADGSMVFMLTVTTQKANQGQADELLDAIYEELQSRSIYRGRCIDIGGSDPRFFNPFQIARAEEVIVSDVNLANLRGLILNPIKYSDRARTRNKRLLKRTFLLLGEYGTGKTLTMGLLAQWAIMHGWTAIRVRPGQDVDDAFRLARKTGPSLVLLEDADVLAGAQDPKATSALLEKFDGAMAKADEIITVMTSNFVENITVGMTRPGRIDGMFTFGSLDRVGVENLFRVKLGDRLAGETRSSGSSNLFDEVELSDAYALEPVDFDAVFEACAQYPPSFIGEIVQRAESFVLNRENPKLTTYDLVSIAEGLDPQYQIYLNGPMPKHEVTMDDTMGDIVTSRVSSMIVDINGEHYPIKQVDQLV